jgi:L,D-transpeptidase-like protein
MLRDVALISAAMVALQVMCPGAHASVSAAPQPKHVRSHRESQHFASFRHLERHVVSLRGERPPVVPPMTESPQPAPDQPPELTYQELRVSQLAARQGDRNFLMVDKAAGKIILFQNVRPVFSGPALTGQSLADQLPANAMNVNFDAMTTEATKITPAGRFTVSRHHDNEYGTVLDINEIRGKDWGIAIHQVYLGTPSEHREQRLMSPSENDKHITYGCINVTPATIGYLLSVLPENQPTPLYILPADNTQTAAYFAARTS